MKKLIIALLLGSSLSSFAQNVFYLQPEAGLGYTNAQVTPKDGNMNVYGQNKTTGFTTYNARIGVGYQFNNWQFSSGVDFLRTGYSINFIGEYWLIGYYGGPERVGMNETRVDHTIALPVKAGYQINISKHLFITPVAGLAVAYNYSERNWQKSTQATFGGYDYTNDYVLKGTALHSIDNLLSLWGNAQLHMGYKVNDKLSVIAGPEVQFMLTSMTNGNLPSQKNYCYSFNAGITWQLAKKVISKTKE